MIFYVALFWLLIVNLTGFALMGIDKRRAKKKMWRIKERTFFIIAFLGGSPGCIFGMLAFRHKTRHASFVWGLPAILAAQLIAASAVYLVFFR